MSDDRMVKRTWWLQAAATAIALGAGFVLGERFSEAEPTKGAFHDMRVIHPEEFSDLIDPEDPLVLGRARELGSLEAAYLFVRDRIVFDPSIAADAPARTLRDGRASCLGKATLLASLYRALGVPSANVRVVTGQVWFADALLEHAWVDLEYGSLCIQQDPTDLLGVHDFLSFPGTAMCAALSTANSSVSTIRDSSPSPNSTVSAAATRRPRSPAGLRVPRWLQAPPPVPGARISAFPAPRLSGKSPAGR